MICAALSLCGFVLRSYWMFKDDPRLKHILSKRLPHVIDTVLLASAVAMLVIWQVSPFAMSWLTAKIVALLVYIVLGMIALRFGKTKTVRVGASIAATCTVFYIVSVAFTKSPWGLLSVL